MSSYNHNIACHRNTILLIKKKRSLIIKPNIRNHQISANILLQQQQYTIIDVIITIPKNGRIVPSIIPSKAPLGCSKICNFLKLNQSIYMNQELKPTKKFITIIFTVCSVIVSSTQTPKVVLCQSRLTILQKSKKIVFIVLN